MTHIDPDTGHEFDLSSKKIEITKIDVVEVSKCAGFGCDEPVKIPKSIYNPEKDYSDFLCGACNYIASVHRDKAAKKVQPPKEDAQQEFPEADDKSKAAGDGQ